MILRQTVPILLSVLRVTVVIIDTLRVSVLFVGALHLYHYSIVIVITVESHITAVVVGVRGVRFGPLVARLGD